MSDQALIQDDLERTFRDVTDPGYSEPLEQDGVGWDAVAGSAAILSRASSAIETNSQAAYLLPSSRQTAPSASGQAQARALLLAARSAGQGAFALTIPTGKAVVPTLKDSRGNPAQLESYQLAEPIVFGVGELGPVEVEAVCLRPGDQGNLRQADAIALGLEGARKVALSSIVGMVLTDTGVPDVFTAGDVGRYLQIQGEGVPRRISAYSQDVLGRGQVVVEGDAITGAGAATLREWAELGVTLTQLTEFSGGRHATLDQIGYERAMPRGPGEADLDYAYRISELPDVVSPAAIARICARILSPLGLSWTFTETRERGLTGFVLDQTPLDAGRACAPAWAWSGAVLMSLNATKRFFLICIEPDPGTLGPGGLYLDAANAGINFYDCAEAAGDGSSPAYGNALATLRNALNTARLAGVDWRLIETQAYAPFTRRAVTLTVTIFDGSSGAMATRNQALAAFFQDLAPGQSTREVTIAEAVSSALRAGGYTPGCTVFTTSSLVAAPREKLEYVLAP